MSTQHLLRSADYYHQLEDCVPPDAMSSFGWLVFANSWLRLILGQKSHENKAIFNQVSKLGIDLNSIAIGKEKESALRRVLSQSEGVMEVLSRKGITEPWPDSVNVTSIDDYCAHMLFCHANTIVIQSRFLLEDKQSTKSKVEIDQNFSELAMSALLVVSYAACIDNRRSKFAPLIKQQARLLHDNFGGKFGPAVDAGLIKKLDQVAKGHFADSVQVIPFDGVVFDKKLIAVSLALLLVGVLSITQQGFLAVISASFFILLVCSITAIYMVKRSQLLGLRSKVLLHFSGALIFIEGLYLVAHLLYR